MKNPLVSVIIPTYNRKKYVVKAIDSVLNQTYKNIEIIVIDDGSTNGTDKIISELSKKNSKIVFLRNETNLGFVKTLNKAISGARGKYIARIDDDDLWRDKDKLTKQVEFLENNREYILTGGGVVKINKSGGEIIRYLLPEKDKTIRKIILSSNPFIHSSVIFLRDIWEKAGGYKEEFGFFADWELWLSMGRFGKLYNFPDFFVNYLDNEQNIIGNSHDIQIRRKLKEVLKMKKNYKNYYPGYIKAVLFSFLSYFYSFLPFREKISNIVFKIKKIFFGLSPNR